MLPQVQTRSTANPPEFRLRERRLSWRWEGLDAQEWPYRIQTTNAADTQGNRWQEADRQHAETQQRAQHEEREAQPAIQPTSADHPLATDAHYLQEILWRDKLPQHQAESQQRAIRQGEMDETQPATQPASAGHDLATNAPGMQQMQFREHARRQLENLRFAEMRKAQLETQAAVADHPHGIWSQGINSMRSEYTSTSPQALQVSHMVPQAAPRREAVTRNLVLCLDGTSNQFSKTNTNVIKLFGVLKISSGLDQKEQLAYYDSGVGTYLPVGASGAWSRKRQKMAKALDLATAWNFKDHVKNAYKWLMDYYQPKDKIFLFGFSRGAYAVRVLAGMIEKVGLLPAGNHSQIPLAYDVYKSLKHVGSRRHPSVDLELAANYLSMFGISRPVNVHFIGVWDTVSSLGGLRAPELPFADTVSMVTYFRQALALDERRVKFQPEFRHQSSDIKEQFNGIMRNKEVWFLGVHTAVGGGSDPENGPSLSNVPFRWMLWEAVQCGLRTSPTGILQSYALMSIPEVAKEVREFVPELILRQLKPNLPRVSPDGRVSLKRKLTSELQDTFTEDLRVQIIRIAAEYDTQLHANPVMAKAGLPMTPDLKCSKKESLRGAYVAMEHLPLQRRWYETDAKTGEYVERRDKTPNRGDGRYIQTGQKIHLSVLKRALYDQAVAATERSEQGLDNVSSKQDHEPYPPIHAHLFPSMVLPRTWPDALKLTSASPDLWDGVREFRDV